MLYDKYKKKDTPEKPEEVKFGPQTRTEENEQVMVKLRNQKKFKAKGC